MKFWILLGILLLVSFSEQVAKFNHCHESIAKDTSFDHGCAEITCYGDALVRNGCPEVQCGENQKVVGNREGDQTKVYPECCGGPICDGPI